MLPLRSLAAPRPAPRLSLNDLHAGEAQATGFLRQQPHGLVELIRAAPLVVPPNINRAAHEAVHVDGSTDSVGELAI